MSTLLVKLRQEHVEILHRLDAIKTLGAASDAGRAALAQLGEMVVGHLGREDDEVYPRLRAVATREPRLKKTLDFFAAESREISDLARRFFSARLEGSGDFEVAQEFGTLCARLTARARREETVLFPEFERIARGDPDQ